jgi:hypothetical protein
MDFLYTYLKEDSATPDEIKKDYELAFNLPFKKAMWGLSLKRILSYCSGFYYDANHDLWYIKPDEAGEYMSNLYCEFADKYGPRFMYPEIEYD